MTHGVAGAGDPRTPGVAGAGDPLGGRELLDLVCGPASPLPETYQRYRLIARLGAGGQADVFRAVRLCGGVTSAPMTVKVFRVDPRRPLVDELRSWDKGDAALMDLNNRGVTGICRRADGFYGPPPHRPGQSPSGTEAVPYQVYDYLHGVNLREYITRRAGTGLPVGAARLNGLAALRTLAGILRALHHPQQSGATPVLHMDVKPSNIMVLATGEVRLIDFTGARYWRPEEITQIAYTPESAGPEALDGVSHLTPAYDVHGFGAVAYYLITGETPRESGASNGRPHLAGTDEASGRAVLRRHPMLEQLPAMRDHLHAPLADRPGERPSTRELADWVDQLGRLVHRLGAADVGVDWTEPGAEVSARVVGRASPAVAGTETDAFERIEKLERELVELRAAVGAPGGTPAGAHTHGNGYHRDGSAPASVLSSPVAGARHGAPARDRPLDGARGERDPAPQTRVAGGYTLPGALQVDSTALPAPAGAAGYRPASPPDHATSRLSDRGPVTVPDRGPADAGESAHPPASNMVGRASVPRVHPQVDPTGVIAEPDESQGWRPAPREDPRALKLGWELTGVGVVFAFVCWGIWAASNRANLTVPLLTFGLVLVVAAGVFMLMRLLGRLILVQRLGRTRRSARGAHALTGLFLVASGVAWLGMTPWVVTVYTWLRSHLTG